MSWRVQTGLIFKSGKVMKLSEMKIVQDLGEYE